MLSSALGISEWDPLGLAAAAPPAPAGSVEAKLEASRSQLHGLKRAVSRFLDRVSTTPFDESDSSEAIVQALNAAAAEHEEQEELHQREVMGLRQTVQLLQAEHRKRLTASMASEAAPAPSAAVNTAAMNTAAVNTAAVNTLAVNTAAVNAEAMNARGEEAALHLKAEVEVERLRSALRTAQDALIAERRAAAAASQLKVAREGANSGTATADKLAIVQAKLAESATLLSAREDARRDLESRLREIAARAEAAAARAETAEGLLFRERHLAAQAAATGAEELRLAIANGNRAAATAAEACAAAVLQGDVGVAVMGVEVGEMDRWKSSVSEAHARAMATTRDRAAKMLASKDEEIATLRRKVAAAAIVRGGNSGGGNGGKSVCNGGEGAAVIGKGGSNNGGGMEAAVVYLGKDGGTGAADAIGNGSKNACNGGEETVLGNRGNSNGAGTEAAVGTGGSSNRGSNCGAERAADGLNGIGGSSGACCGGAADGLNGVRGGAECQSTQKKHPDSA